MTLIEKTVSILIIVLVTTTLFGWINNLVQFIKLDFQEPYKAEIIRGVGIPVVPFGIVIGYINIKDKQENE